MDGRRPSASEPDATVATASGSLTGVLQLQRLVGNRATVSALSEMGVGPRSGLVIQRVTGFEVEGKTQRYGQDAEVIVFDRGRTAIDAAELDKIAWLAPRLTDGQPIGLRAFASEDEGDLEVVATARRTAVREALKANKLADGIEVRDVPHGLADAKGNFDYREMRRVQILSGDALDEAMAAPPPAGDGRVHGTNKEAYGTYGVAASFDSAEKMLDQAAGLIAALPEEPAADNKNLVLFRKYFATAKPSEVAKRLRQARGQIAHYRPEAPIDVNAPAGGHACLDETRPGIQYLNQGVGPQARLIIGAEAKSFSPGEQAYNVVHEATHGSPELQTRDHAYIWQGTFRYLSPEQQFDNADSYAVLVALLAGLSQAPPGASKEEAATYDLARSEAVEKAATAGLTPAMDAVLKKTWAWLEHYMTQVWINLRDLYQAIAPPGPKPGEMSESSYTFKLTQLAKQHLGIELHEFAKVAGVIDRVEDMKSKTTFGKPLFTDAEQEAQPNDTFVVPAKLGTDEGEVMRWQLDNIIQSTDTIIPALHKGYKDFITATVVMSGWGGPLA